LFEAGLAGLENFSPGKGIATAVGEGTVYVT